MTASIPSEGWDINLKLKTHSFGFRLWMYFALFTAFIFIVLWLLQTVFLQSFYNDMVIRNTKNAAESIVDNSTSDDINDVIDDIAHDNSILVYITDEDGSLLYSSDEWGGMKKKTNVPDNSASKARKIEKRPGGYRSLPDEYDRFLKSLSESSDGTVELRDESYYVYGTYIDYYHSDKKAVLYVGATIEAVGSSVNIISMQLVWVTVLSVIVGIILSMFIAKRFSSPVDRLSAKAKKLGEKDYENGYQKGFCTELDELSDTLDRTNKKLIESKEFQMELLANVSHDLRTPLTMIKGYAEMIRDISWEDEEQCGNDVATIIKEADRLTALVNEILEYSELKSDGGPEPMEKTDLSRISSSAADSFKALKKPEGITVETDIEPGIFINGNEVRLQRALYNLMDNASRHAGSDKTIKVSLISRDRTAVLSVADHGEGIPKEEIDHIWDRYYTSRMRKGKGVSGLGLAIVKQITELHGGKCLVRSEKGKGSEFIIELPQIG